MWARCSVPVSSRWLRSWSCAELTHFDRVLNRGTRAMKPWVFWCARDGDHLQVQLGSQTAIEAEFFLAEEVPFGKRREIDKAQIDRLLIL